MLMHVMASEQETSRPLLTPDEVMRLPKDAALIFVAGSAPVYGRKLRYYQDPVFSERAKIPPPPQSDRLTHDWSHWTSRAVPTDGGDTAAGGLAAPTVGPIGAPNGGTRTTGGVGRWL